MTESKKWYESKTIIAMLVWWLWFALPYLWFELGDADVTAIVTDTMQIFGIIVGIYWRLSANKKVTY